MVPLASTSMENFFSQSCTLFGSFFNFHIVHWKDQNYFIWFGIPAHFDQFFSKSKVRDKSSCLAVGEKGTSSCLSPSPEEAKYTTSTKRKHNVGEMCRNYILYSNCHAQSQMSLQNLKVWSWRKILFAKIFDLIWRIRQSKYLVGFYVEACSFATLHCLQL